MSLSYDAWINIPVARDKKQAARVKAAEKGYSGVSAYIRDLIDRDLAMNDPNISNYELTRSDA